MLLCVLVGEKLEQAVVLPSKVGILIPPGIFDCLF